MNHISRNLTAPQAIQLALHYQQAGELQKAETVCRKVLQAEPNNPEALHLLGIIAYLTKHYKAAVELIRRAININDKVPVFFSNIGLALHAMGQFTEAAASFQRGLALNPDFAEAHNNLGNSLKELGRPDDALACYQRALKLNPNYVEAHYNLGNVHKDMGKHDEAEACYQRALSLRPDFAEAMNNMGFVFQKQGKLDEAGVYYKKALSVKPDFAEASNNLGSVFQELGKFDEAVEWYLRAVNLNRDYVEAYYGLVNCKKFGPEDEQLLARIEECFEKKKIDEEKAVDLHFALGKIYDDIGRYEKAFTNFEKANRLQCRGYRFNRELFEQRISKLIDMFTRDFFKEMKCFGNPADMPILIVGMPRSGTTLVEQIISCHPDIFGAGELNFWHDQEQKLKYSSGADFPREAINSIADAYITHLRSFSSTARHVSDKMPHNFLSLGLIHLTFPLARIIHCRRNPADTCLSIYFKKFIAKTHPYSCDLGDLAFYYSQYERLMQHWREVLPPHAFYEVQYEDLVADNETVSRGIIDFCGLEWHEGCLEPHKNERIVRTPSNWQVRQPIYKTSVERWRNYEHFIGALAPVMK
jgi:tetratricopeptide (TPR) repeat protein